MDHLDLLEIVTTLVHERDDVMYFYRSNNVKRGPLHRKEVTISYYVIILVCISNLEERDSVEFIDLCWQLSAVDVT